MKFPILTTLTTLGLCTSGHAAISIVETDGSIVGGTGGLEYDTTLGFTTTNSANVGDYIIITHANNKRDNGSQTIGVDSTTANLISTTSAGDLGSGDAAWAFVLEVTTAGTQTFTLTNTNSTKTVSHTTSYWLIEADGIGESLAISGTAGNSTTTNSNTINLGANAGDYGFAGVVGSVNSEAASATGWTLDLANGNNRRENFTNSSLSGGTDTFSWASAQNTGVAAVAITAVPEPSSTALLGLGGLALLLRRRRSS